MKQKQKLGVAALQSELALNAAAITLLERTRAELLSTSHYSAARKFKRAICTMADDQRYLKDVIKSKRTTKRVYKKHGSLTSDLEMQMVGGQV